MTEFYNVPWFDATSELSLSYSFGWVINPVTSFHPIKSSSNVE